MPNSSPSFASRVSSFSPSFLPSFLLSSSSSIDVPSGRFDLPVSHGHLEAILKEPPRPIFAAVACHPHPQAGGTMHNNVIYRVARAMEENGGAVLRFNFRGVGRSTGAYGEAIAEREDVTAALDYLASRYPRLPLWVAGFSFGSRVGLPVGAVDPRVQKLLGVGLALSIWDFGFLRACPKPKAFLQAADDEYGGETAIRALVDTLPEPKRLTIVPNATHLFPGRLDALEAAAADLVRWLLGQTESGHAEI